MLYPVELQTPNQIVDCDGTTFARIRNDVGR